MPYTNPLLNAVLGALLGILIVIWRVWGHPREHVWLLVIVATLCAILGYAYGEPFIMFIRRLLPRI